MLLEFLCADLAWSPPAISLACAELFHPSLALD